MPQYRVFQVKDNRFHFKCPDCQTKRILPVPPAVRTKNVKCHRCGKVAKCILNRRLTQRQSQSGKATMILAGGRELSIDLHDISPNGLSCSIDVNVAPMISITDEVHFSCGWNPDLFTRSSYIIKNIQGNRVSVQGKTHIPRDFLR